MIVARKIHVAALMTVIAVLVSFFSSAVRPASAEPLPVGKKAITLIAADGARLPIGSVVFKPDGDAATIEVELDTPDFAEEFLSMRPFRCLAGAKETWCQLPYPYEIKNRITVSDLADLEYALLFLFKPPSGYGIDAWNGLYYKLALEKDGAITGALHEADFNVLAVPPEKGVLRPIEPSALTRVAPDAHRYSKIEIR